MELESSFVKLAFIQCGAMKSLGTILSCSNFTEFILVPKKKRNHARPSTSEGTEKDGEKSDEEAKAAEEPAKACPKCGKEGPQNKDGECPYCSDSVSLQNALAEAFRYLVNVS